GYRGLSSLDGARQRYAQQTAVIAAAAKSVPAGSVATANLFDRRAGGQRNAPTGQRHSHVTGRFAGSTGDVLRRGRRGRHARRWAIWRSVLRSLPKWLLWRLGRGRRLRLGPAPLFL